jgi:hypothetical protein
VVLELGQEDLFRTGYLRLGLCAGSFTLSAAKCEGMRQMAQLLANRVCWFREHGLAPVRASLDQLSPTPVPLVCL